MNVYYSLISNLSFVNKRSYIFVNSFQLIPSDLVIFSFIKLSSENDLSFIFFLSIQIIYYFHLEFRSEVLISSLELFLNIH